MWGERDQGEAIPTLLDRLNGLASRASYEYSPVRPVGDGADMLVLSSADLADPAAPEHARFLAVMAQKGFGDRQRLISASLALRLGWAAGFQIGAYLLERRLPHVRSLSLVLERGLVSRVVIHDAALEDTAGLEPAERRVRMAARLHAEAAPFVRAHHGWSRLSARALFSMLESSWAGLFVTIGEAVGRSEEFAEEARAVLSAHPVLAADAPALYPVEAGGRRKTCQRRTLCCLYYRMPEAGYCGSCPILSDEDRALRQRRYVSEYGLPMAATGG